MSSMLSKLGEEKGADVKKQRSREAITLNYHCEIYDKNSFDNTVIIHVRSLPVLFAPYRIVRTNSTWFVGFVNRSRRDDKITRKRFYFSA